MKFRQQQRPPMSRGNLLPTARHCILPEGIVSTGYPAVENTCQQIGIKFDQWQQDLNRAILAKNKDGHYAADTVVMSIPRQVGKTFDVGALVFADSIINPGTTTVWTAHRFKVSRETFTELRAWARSPLLAPHIEYDEITSGAGNETIPFRNGSRIVFAARERGAIRGFTKVRRLILDEAQILTEAAMSDLAPTMNQVEDPQIILMGTPPRPGKDPGETFSDLRKNAIAGEAEDVLYVEFSADANASLDLNDPKTWEQVAKANPSYPQRTSKRSIRRLRRLLTNDDDFRREVYGIWDVSQQNAIFGDGNWEAGLREQRPIGLAVGALGVAVSIDGTFSAIVAGAIDDQDNSWVKPLHHAPGMGWVVDSAKELQAETGAIVTIDGRGPGAVLIPLLEREGVRLKILQTSDILNACASFEQSVREGRLFYEEAPELNAAVAGAKKRSVGDRWAWGRKGADDISPLEGATIAAWAASPSISQVSAYEDDTASVVML